MKKSCLQYIKMMISEKGNEEMNKKNIKRWSVKIH